MLIEVSDMEAQGNVYLITWCLVMYLTSKVRA